MAKPSKPLGTPTSVRLDKDIIVALETLAAATERPKSWHVERAVLAYVASEMTFIQAVRKGRADIDAGNGVEWEQAKAELSRIVNGDRTQ